MGRTVLSSAANTLRVLEHLVEVGEAGVSDVARDLELTVGTAHRLISTLVGTGFAEQDPSNRRYRPGPKIGELARRMHGSVDLISLAHTHLDRLMSTAQETTNLGVLRDDEVVYVDRVVTDQPLAVSVRVGSRVPAFCTGLGRVLLAFGPEGRRDDYERRLRDIAKGAEQRAPSAKALRTILDDVRADGYASDDGDFSEDIGCVAAPILGADGTAVAAISVSGLRSRVRERKAELTSLVTTTAKELSGIVAALGEEVRV